MNLDFVSLTIIEILNRRIKIDHTTLFFPADFCLSIIYWNILTRNQSVRSLKNWEIYKPNQAIKDFDKMLLCWNIQQWPSWLISNSSGQKLISLLRSNFSKISSKLSVPSNHSTGLYNIRVLCLSHPRLLLLNYVLD